MLSALSISSTTDEDIPRFTLIFSSPLLELHLSYRVSRAYFLPIIALLALLRHLPLPRGELVSQHPHSRAYNQFHAVGMGEPAPCSSHLLTGLLVILFLYPCTPLCHNGQALFTPKAMGLSNRPV